MSSPKLPNYLRAHRKRLGLSQTEVAFLLGVQSGAKVSRHERFTREPALETAFAYEAICNRPASELIAGLYGKVEQEVAARAKILLARTLRMKASRQTARKRETLEAIAAAKEKKPRS